MKVVFLALVIFLSFACLPSNADAGVNSLQINGDVVLFSLEGEKNHTSPACVTAENAHLWSISLASDSGRAIYSLILTAMAKANMSIDVESAGDCGVIQDVERAAKVNLVATNASQNSASGTIGRLAVYKGDLSERLGTMVAFISNNRWVFLTENGRTTATEDIHRANMVFSEPDCTGDVYASISHREDRWYYNPDFESGKIFLPLDATVITPASSLHAYSDGICENLNTSPRTVYPIQFTSTELCGDYLCKIVEE